MPDIQRGPKAVQSGQGRRLTVWGERVTLKLTGEDTVGVSASVEISTPPQVGPPLHVHQREDIVLYVLEGMYEVRVGGQMIPAPPGTCVFLPREIPHSYTNVGYRTGRLLVTIAPAGFEEFYEEISPDLPGSPVEQERIVAVGKKYGLDIL